MKPMHKSFLSLATIAACCVSSPVFADGHICDGKCKGTAECSCSSCTCEAGKPCSCDASCKGHTCKDRQADNE